MRRLAVLTALFLLFIGTNPIVHNMLYGMSDDINLNSHDVIIIEQTLETEEGQFLVPMGVIKGANDVDKVTIHYRVITNADETLIADVQNIQFRHYDKSFSDEYQLINTDFDYVVCPTSTETMKIYDITLTITLNRPETEAHSTMIQGATVTFDVIIRGA